MLSIHREYMNKNDVPEIGDEESRLLVYSIIVEQRRMSLVRLSSSCGVLREYIGRSVWYGRMLFGVGVCGRVDMLRSSGHVLLNEVYSRSCMFGSEC